MDYARKIGKTGQAKLWEARSKSFTTISDVFLSEKEEKYVEDRRLVNWKKWLQDRNNQYDRIKTNTGRHQVDQVLNSCEKVRPLIEIRNLIHHASAITLPVKLEKDQDASDFWQTAKNLANRDDAFLGENDLKDPELLYVDLPELIVKEKNLQGIESKEPLWKNSLYLKKRREELRREIGVLGYSKEPETRRLVIEGFAPREKKIERRIPPITISPPEAEYYSPSSQTIALKIQDREIVWQKSSFENQQVNPDPLEWKLSFSGNIEERTERKIVFESKGNRVIVYEWRKTNPSSLPIRFRERPSPFVFNKTKGIILPGQIVELQIWYVPNQYGIFTESWRLVTDPVLCPSPLTFQFWGCTAIDETRQTLEEFDEQSIDRYLDSRARDSLIRIIIRDILEEIKESEPPLPPYGTLFLEAEIFIAKNPLSYYRPSILMEFRKIYYEAIDDQSKSWNLSLDDLRDILLKTREPDRRNAVLTEFNQLYKLCLQPSLYSFNGINKYAMVYNTLCFFMNRFEYESEYTMSCCSMKDCSGKSTQVPEANIKDAKSTKASRRSMSIKSNNSLAKGERKTSVLEENVEAENVVAPRSSTFDVDYPGYKEIFYIRIHQFLGDTIDQIGAIICSIRRLSETDK